MCGTDRHARARSRADPDAGRWLDPAPPVTVGARAPRARTTFVEGVRLVHAAVDAGLAVDALLTSLVFHSRSRDQPLRPTMRR